MAFAAAALPAIGSFFASGAGAALMTAATVGAQLIGASQQASAERAAGRAEQEQARRQASYERAIAQRDAARRNEEGRRLSGRQQSLAAASGFEATDPTSVSLATSLNQASSLEELLALANGEERARNQEYSGDLALYGAKQRARATMAEGVGNAISSISGWRQRYGGGGGRAPFKSAGYFSASPLPTG